MSGRFAALVVAFALCAAPAQAQPVRLAAPADCLVNAGCGVGLESVYGLKASTVFVALSRADAGIAALDDEQAEVAVAFSSNPALSRPDIVTLRDDRGMSFADRVVPVVRSGLLRAYGGRASGIRRLLNDASATLSTLALRGLNQAVIDGRTPERAAAEYLDTNGLGGTGATRRSLRHTLGRIDAEPMRYAGAQDRNVFVTKSSTAAALRLTRISDLARYWPAA